jgi:hypothetical protein
VLGAMFLLFNLILANVVSAVAFYGGIGATIVSNLSFGKAGLFLCSTVLTTSENP